VGRAAVGGAHLALSQVHFVRVMRRRRRRTRVRGSSARYQMRLDTRSLVRTGRQAGGRARRRRIDSGACGSEAVAPSVLPH